MTNTEYWNTLSDGTVTLMQNAIFSKEAYVELDIQFPKGLYIFEDQETLNNFLLYSVERLNKE